MKNIAKVLSNTSKAYVALALTFLTSMGVQITGDLSQGVLISIPAATEWGASLASAIVVALGVYGKRNGPKAKVIDG